MKVYYVYKNCGIAECEVKKESAQRYTFTSRTHKKVFGYVLYCNIQDEKENFCTTIEDAVVELKRRINTSIVSHEKAIRDLESSLSILEKFSEKDYEQD